MCKKLFTSDVNVCFHFELRSSPPIDGLSLRKIVQANHLHRRGDRPLGEEVSSKFFPPLPRGGGSQFLTDGEVFVLIFAITLKSM